MIEIPQCDDCGSTEFRYEPPLDEKKLVKASEYFKAKIQVRNLSNVHEKHTAICVGCGRRYDYYSFVGHITTMDDEEV